MQQEKRLVQLFKNFVERTLIPQIRKFNGSVMEWEKFSSLVSQDTLNYGQIQAYVQSFPPVSSLPTYEKGNTPVFLKRKDQQSQQQQPGSFANKTFGGERARMALLQKMDFDDSAGKDLSYGNSNNRNSNPITSNGPSLQSLDRLYKTFADNQSRLQSILGTGYDVGGYDSKQYR